MYKDIKAKTTINFANKVLFCYKINLQTKQNSYLLRILLYFVVFHNHCVMQIVLYLLKLSYHEINSGIQ